MECNLTVKDIMSLLNDSLETNEINLDSKIYVSTEPCNQRDKCIENAKPICSACSCEANKHLVLLIKN